LENSSPGDVADSLGKVRSPDSSDAGSDGPISSQKKRPSDSNFDASLKRVRAEDNSNTSNGYALFPVTDPDIEVVTISSDGEEEILEVLPPASKHLRAWPLMMAGDCSQR